MKKWALVALCISFLAACQLQPKIERSVSSNACQVSAQYPLLFNIVKNDSREIVVELGDYAKMFDLSDSYKYTVSFSGSKENKNEKEVELFSRKADGAKTIVSVPVTKTGVYIFTIENVWRQKVFAVAPTEDTLSADQKDRLAKQYAPLIDFHREEKYYPVTLEYLLNEVDTDPQLAREPFILKAKSAGGRLSSYFSKPTLNVKFEFDQIRQILPYYGHSDSVLKSGLDRLDQTRLKDRYGDRHVAMYYSVFENPKWKEIYINYHMFYAFDPKNSSEEKVAMAAHIFDRESITVVLRSTTLKPLYVFYGAHLASQTMAYLDDQDKVLQSWKTGRVFVNWPEIIKVGDRPVAAAALGSHGMYPIKGHYAVMIGQIKALREPAGGGHVLTPQFDPVSYDGRRMVSYQLKPLNLKGVTSDCRKDDNILAFSGSTVDVLGPTNATFPPFTDREEDYFSYADPNAPLFEMPRR